MNRRLSIIGLFVSLGGEASAFVADHSNVIENHWVDAKPQIKASMTLGFETEVSKINPSAAKLLERLMRSQSEATIEGVYISLGRKKNFSTKTSKFADLFALPGKATPLKAWIHGQLPKAEPLKRDSPFFKLALTPEVADWVDFGKLSEKKYATDHHRMIISSKRLRKNRKKFRQFLAQVKPFLIKGQRQHLMQKIKKGRLIDLERDLLPSFARKMSQKYLLYRGPNCFHAALAFQDQKLTRSSLFNVRREQGYHRAMINYDELWRTLSTQFYEVNTQASELKFGDILVFFDRPQNSSTLINYRWIRHASTWLFDGYVFSKGSKSPNSAYAIKPFDDEWSTWDKYLGNMAVKVFRKHRKSGKNRPSDRLTDWLY